MGVVLGIENINNILRTVLKDVERFINEKTRLFIEYKRIIIGFLICTGFSTSAFSQTTGKIVDANR